uniref:Uncharacterized protein n=1 Tax=Oryza punctata TaxID=4537 RepID=A0A0E0KKM7_ORYPU
MASWASTRSTACVVQAPQRHRPERDPRPAAPLHSRAGHGLAEAAPYTVMFHPTTGRCVVRRSCGETEAWAYTASMQRLAPRDRPLLFCASACRAATGWRGGALPRDFKLHLAVNASSSSSSGGGGGMLCLDVGDDGQSLIPNPCRCLSADNICDPESQWFKMHEETSVSLKRARAPRKRPNQAYNEAAALLASIHPSVFPVKKSPKTASRPPARQLSGLSAVFDPSSDLLPPLPVLADAAFLLRDTPATSPTPQNCSSPAPVSSAFREFRDPAPLPASPDTTDEPGELDFDDDCLDADSILDVDEAAADGAAEGIYGIMGSLTVETNTTATSSDDSILSSSGIHPYLRSLMVVGLAGRFELGLGSRHGARPNLNRALKTTAVVDVAGRVSERHHRDTAAAATATGDRVEHHGNAIATSSAGEEEEQEEEGGEGGEGEGEGEGGGVARCENCSSPAPVSSAFREFRDPAPLPASPDTTDEPGELDFDDDCLDADSILDVDEAAADGAAEGIYGIMGSLTVETNTTATSSDDSILSSSGIHPYLRSLMVVGLAGRFELGLGSRHGARPNLNRALKGRRPWWMWPAVSVKDITVTPPPPPQPPATASNTTAMPSPPAAPEKKKSKKKKVVKVEKVKAREKEEESPDAKCKEEANGTGEKK